MTRRFTDDVAAGIEAIDILSIALELVIQPTRNP
jgi:hypothetical protein